MSAFTQQPSLGRKDTVGQARSIKLNPNWERNCVGQIGWILHLASVPFCSVPLDCRFLVFFALPFLPSLLLYFFPELPHGSLLLSLLLFLLFLLPQMLLVVVVVCSFVVLVCCDLVAV